MELKRLNMSLGSLLQRSRMQMGLSRESVADTLELDYEEIIFLEASPIRMPLCRLFQAIKLYNIYEEVSWLLLYNSTRKPIDLQT